MEEMDEKRISVTKAAALLGVSTSRVRQMISEEKLKASKAGKLGWYKVSLLSVQEASHHKSNSFA